MASRRCTDVQARPTEFLDFTSLTLDEFQPLVPPFAAAYQAPLAAWRLEGKPRPARRCTVDKPWPLPTPQERRFGMLTSLQTSALQGVHGRLCGRGQSQAQQWSHGLWPALLAALRPRGEAPARSRPALAPRRGGSEADAAAGGPPLAQEPTPAPDSPLWPLTGPHGASSAPKPLWNRPRVLAARKRSIR